MEMDMRYRFSALFVPADSYTNYFCIQCGNKLGETSGQLLSVSDIHDDSTRAFRFSFRCDGKWCRAWHEIRNLSLTSQKSRVEIVLADEKRSHYRTAYCPRCGNDIGYLSNDKLETDEKTYSNQIDPVCDNCQSPFIFWLKPKGATI